MSSVADILQALGENAANASLRRGAIYGNLVAGASQLPAVISADRDRDAAVKLHTAQVQQQMTLEQARAQREDQLAGHQNAADAKAVLDQQHLGAIIGAGFSADPKTFDQGAAVTKAQQLGRPDLIPTVAAVHEKFTKKPTILKEGEQGFDATTNAPIPGMAVGTKAKTQAELAADAANPASPTQAQSTTALDLLKPPKAEKPALTYGAPFSATVGGKSKFVRAGSDGKVYGLDGKEVPSDQIQPEGDKAPANSYQLQPELDATGKQTWRFFSFNTKTNKWEIPSGQGPTATKAAPGAAAAATEAKTKTETLDTLKQLDAAIEDAKDKIGPGSGRVSNIEQMIGSADPKVQALGVKMKAAKMQFDHAITGSVRAGASPLLIQQWDNILANKVTPEGLKAGVQAMRELLGGGIAPKPGSGIKSITEIKD
jgi:hypothetical protein